MLRNARHLRSMGLLVVSAFSLFMFISCGTSAGTISPDATPNPTTNSTSVTSEINPSPTVTTNCLGYEKTGVGNTASYNITVNQGCDVIVQAFAGRNVGPYNWDGGAVAALGAGSYSFMIQDGSYQMASEANARAAFCNAVNYIQTNGKALSHLYPLPGWGNC